MRFWFSAALEQQGLDAIGCLPLILLWDLVIDLAELSCLAVIVLGFLGR